MRALSSGLHAPNAAALRQPVKLRVEACELLRNDSDLRAVVSRTISTEPSERKAKLCSLGSEKMINDSRLSANFSIVVASDLAGASIKSLGMLHARDY